METNGENINRTLKIKPNLTLTLNEMGRWNEIGLGEVSDDKLGGKSKQS